MWELKKIAATNVCAFREFEYTPVQGVATLVFGENLDNDSQDSNGSGKSALIEAIAIGILGTPLRKAKADEIINDFASQAVITLTLGNPVLRQTMTVRRTFDRKADQTVEVFVNDEKVDLPNVLESNRYVLEAIGLTRDQILNTYILCAYHFESFIDSSDAAKKRIINIFSNGGAVDQSMDALQDDIIRAEERRSECERTLAASAGSVDAIRKEIESFAEGTEARARRKRDMVAAHTEAIAQERSRIREAKVLIEADNDFLDTLVDFDGEMKAVEDSPDNITQALPKVKDILGRYRLNALATDWSKATLDQQIAVKEHQDRLDGITEELKEIAEEMADANRMLADSEERLSVAEQTEKIKGGPLVAMRETKENELADIEGRLRKLKESKAAIEDSIFIAKAMLDNLVTCPRCQHHFHLKTNESESSIKETIGEYERKLLNNKHLLNKRSEEAEAARGSVARIDEDIQALRRDVRDARDSEGVAAEAVRKLERRLGEANHREARERQAVRDMIDRLGDMRARMFDEAFRRADEKQDALEAEMEQAQRRISTALANITAYEEAIATLEGVDDDVDLAAMKERLAEYTAAMEGHAAALGKAKEAEEMLKGQMVRFNGFKAHLANTKIDAMSDETNRFLEHIGSDLRIRFSGYTMLKSGKMRDKISISMMRDGRDCGSFGKLSVGERSRGVLANVLALHRLCNANCPDGRGLNFLILDEILDSTDETGIARTAEALSGLGLTSIIITHIPVAESWPHVLVVTKENGTSTIRQQ